MKVSLKWLNNYVETPADLKAFCDRLDLTGTGVEGVEKLGAAFDKVVTGQIVSKTPHPDSDHMWVTQVDVGGHNTDDTGNPTPLQIVCGAQNFNEGDHVVVALVGAVLPGDFKIKKSKLRGVVSMGMNCSARELGLGNDHDGIMILPEDASIGVPIATYLQLGDTVLDLEITPNRPDCLSMVGMAREVGAMYARPFANPLSEMKERLELDTSAPAADETVQITIEDPSRCPRYSAQVIRGVKVGPSPDWMVERLASIGQRSINNIVDVTNYILFLFGQPLHAFDLHKLTDAQGKAHIVVRAAKEGETLTTLDGEQRTLTPDMTVISTPEAGAVALAGVMGGLDSEVTDTTTDILLEAAAFESGRTSRTSRNLGLISESSMRYERGVDDHGIDERAAAAAALIVEVAGGTVSALADGSSSLVDAWPLPTAQRELSFRVSRFCDMMGADIPRDFIVDTLERLGCEVREGAAAEGGAVAAHAGAAKTAAANATATETAAAATTADTTCLQVRVPTFRPDLEREIDLYEEVLRLYGMDRIPSTLPGGRGRIGVRSAGELLRDKINATMQACGLNETMTYSFAETTELDKLRMNTEQLADAVELINPMNSEQAVMRRSIIPGLLRSVAYNQSHGVANIQLYELGRVFFSYEGKQKPKEKEKLAGVLAGAMGNPSWNMTPQPFDFFDGKGVVESLVRELALPKVRFKEADSAAYAHLQPGRGAEIYSAGNLLGWVGELHPLAVDAYDAQAPVVAFELDVDALLKAARPARDFVEVPTYPAVSIDVAFVVDESITHERLMQCMSSAGGKLLASARLFDVYRDEERLGSNKKSLAYALEYRSPDRTLTSEEVEKQHERLVKKVCGATGAEVRG